MAKTNKPEWPNTPPINTLRWRDEGGKISESQHPAVDPIKEKKQ
jgi:hypothetical protein